MIPKVRFREMTLEENVEIIKWAYYENNGVLSVHDYTVKYFPELAKLSLDMDKNEVYKKIEEVVSKDYQKYHKRIIEETKRYNDLWQQYNDQYFTLLSNYLSVELPKHSFKRNQLEILMKQHSKKFAQ